MKRNKKNLKYLWALTAVPLVMATTIAASCSVQSGSQTDSDNNINGGVQQDNTAQINWDTIKTNAQGQATLPSNVTTANLMTLVDWEASGIIKDKLSVTSVKATDEWSDWYGVVSAEITYFEKAREIKIGGFATNVSTSDESNTYSEFVSKLVANDAAKEIPASLITIENIGKYIDVLNGVTKESPSITYSDAEVTITGVSAIDGALNGDFKTGWIKVTYTYTSGDSFSAAGSKEISGFKKA